MSSRNLLPDERHFLDVLLSRPFERHAALREQVRHVSVTGPGLGLGLWPLTRPPRQARPLGPWDFASR